MTDDKDPLADPGHLFDQTNGVVEGLDGDADGTAGSDAGSDPSGIDDGSDLIDDGRARVARETEVDR